LINIRSSTQEGRSIYDAVRYAWSLGKDPQRARNAEFVLAHVQGLVKGAFKPIKWMEATTENFPGFNPVLGRWGFEGEEADETIRKQYVGKRVTGQWARKTQSATPSTRLAKADVSGPSGKSFKQGAHLFACQFRSVPPGAENR
jgi:hypothetical protein